jgi:two-component system, cell cycle response regulator
MSIRFRVAVHGFNAAERNVLEVFFRLASARSAGYVAAPSLADCDFVIADADDNESLHAVDASGRVGDTVFVGLSLPPPGALAGVTRPIDPMQLLASLDLAVARRGLLSRAAPASGTARQAQSSARARQQAHQREVLDFRNSTGFSNSVLTDEDRKLDAVLVVDDSPIARRFLHTRLGRLGYDVHSAESGEEALEMIAQQSFTFVFMDVALGDGMDGFEACRRIKRRPWPIGHAPAVFMVTGRTSAIDRIRGQLAGCDAYLTKPLVEDELHRVLAGHDDAFERVFEPTAPPVD